MKTNPIHEITDSLLDRGVRKMTLLLRHAERSSALQNAQDEPFIALTGKGKQDAYEFGLALPSGIRFRFFSSVRPRCIETAYQIEKGCIKKGARTTVNEIASLLSPTFFVDYEKATAVYTGKGSEYFYRSWLEGSLPEDIIQRPEPASRGLAEWVSGTFRDTEATTINVAVAHDCHIYLVRHCGMQRKLSEFPKAGFLEGIVFYEDHGALMGIDDRRIPIPIA